MSSSRTVDPHISISPLFLLNRLGKQPFAKFQDDDVEEKLESYLDP